VTGLDLLAAAAPNLRSASWGGIWIRADRAELSRVMANAHVARQPPAVSWAAYPRAFAEAIDRGLSEWFGRHQIFGQRFGEGLGTFVLVTTGLLAVSLIVALGKKIFRRARASEAAPAAESEPKEAAPIETPSGAAEWRQELERRLAAEDPSGAARALWWWWAVSLAGDRLDTAWTSRELVVSCGRADLLPLLPRVDQLMYASNTPEAAQVRSAFDELAGALA
jgi:hypothetical protein